jgi:tRNA (Thr-GGU) A37 N-methylase
MSQKCQIRTLGTFAQDTGTLQAPLHAAVGRPSRWREITESVRLRVKPLEAVDGTPVVDIKELSARRVLSKLY